MLAKTASLVALSTLFLGAYADQYVLPLSYQKCDTGSGCQKQNTGIICDSSSSTGKVLPSAAAITSVNGGSGITLSKPISRSYMVNMNTNKYELFNMKNRQISFDVNLGAVKCGYNAALYMVQMPGNATPGTGYCDAQGTCNEMDILEGNIGSQAITPHPCGTLNNGGNCDPWGCSVNTYNSFASQVGPGKTIDTRQTYTITTVFKTTDGTDKGDISSIQQILSQNGRTVTLSLQDNNLCSSDKYWSTTGGYRVFSQAFDIGMVLTFSFWGGPNADSMSWLDSAPNNQYCNQVTGNNVVTFSNIKLDYINGSAPRQTTTAAQRTTTTQQQGQRTTTTTRAPTTTGSSNGGGSCAQKWGQCGGQGYSGPTCCQSSTCTYSNAWYSQCL